MPTLTALENVLLPSQFNRNGQIKNREKRAIELLGLVGLTERAGHLPSELSGGEMQRVAIARALINNPKILRADEPTGNLDTQNAESIYDIFQRLQQEGLTIVVVTHNVELAEKSHRILRLKDGRLHVQ